MQGAASAGALILGASPTLARRWQIWPMAKTHKVFLGLWWLSRKNLYWYKFPSISRYLSPCALPVIMHSILWVNLVEQAILALMEIQCTELQANDAIYGRIMQNCHGHCLPRVPVTFVSSCSMSSLKRLRRPYNGDRDVKAHRKHMCKAHKKDEHLLPGFMTILHNLWYTVYDIYIYIWYTNYIYKHVIMWYDQGLHLEKSMMVMCAFLNTNLDS